MNPEHFDSETFQKLFDSVYFNELCLLDKKKNVYFSCPRFLLVTLSWGRSFGKTRKFSAMMWKPVRLKRSSIKASQSEEKVFSSLIVSMEK